MQELSKAEEIVLLAIWRIGQDAYGVTIRKQIEMIPARITPTAPSTGF